MLQSLLPDSYLQFLQRLNHGLYSISHKLFLCFSLGHQSKTIDSIDSSTSWGLTVECFGFRLWTLESYVFFSIFVILGTSLMLSMICLSHISNKYKSHKIDEWRYGKHSSYESCYQQYVQGVPEFLGLLATLTEPVFSQREAIPWERLEVVIALRKNRTRHAHVVSMWRALYVRQKYCIRSVCKVFQNFEKIIQACDKMRTCQS